jgi:hypothetical protein
MKRPALLAPALGLPLLVGLCALAAGPAQARSTRVAQIPNGGELGCGACHPGTDYSMRNAFGEDVEATLEGTPIESADVAWLEICNLDSDGDGEDNGAELGDPCCAWTDGDAPLDVVSAPGDDTATTGNTCEDGTAVAGMTGGPGDGMGAGSCPLPGVGQTAMGLLFLGSFGLWRRRRLL